MRLTKTFCIFLISIIFLNLGLIYATNINKTNYEYFRIHVIANSDSIDDQLIKYTVSKKVNEYITDITKDIQSKDESKQIIEKNIQTLLNICNKTIKDNNANYGVKAYMGKIEYGEKYMNNYYMSSGTYDSLKIVIGNGLGHNWWSLIYPTSVCENSDKDIFADDVKYSFKIVELVENIFNTLKVGTSN